MNKSAFRFLAIGILAVFAVNGAAVAGDIAEDGASSVGGESWLPTIFGDGAKVYPASSLCPSALNPNSLNIEADGGEY